MMALPCTRARPDQSTACRAAPRGSAPRTLQDVGERGCPRACRTSTPCPARRRMDFARPQHRRRDRGWPSTRGSGRPGLECTVYLHPADVAGWLPGRVGPREVGGWSHPQRRLHRSPEETSDRSSKLALHDAAGGAVRRGDGARGRRRRRPRDPLRPRRQHVGRPRVVDAAGVRLRRRGRAERRLQEVDGGRTADRDRHGRAPCAHVHAAPTPGADSRQGRVLCRSWLFQGFVLPRSPRAHRGRAHRLLVGRSPARTCPPGPVDPKTHATWPPSSAR